MMFSGLKPEKYRKEQSKMKKIMVFMLTLILAISSVSFSLAEEQVTINLWHRWSGTNEEVLNQCIAQFEEKHPEIHVEVTAKAGEYFELLQSMIADAAAGNEKPDVFIGGYNLLNYIAEELDPTNVDELADAAAVEELYSRFTPEMLSLAAYDGEQIGLPLAVSNMVMYVNMDIFKAAGLTEEDIPETWEEVMDVCEIIKEKTDSYGVALDLPDNWPDQCIIFSAGGEMLSADKTRCDFTNEGCIKALQMWQDTYTKGYNTPSTATEQIANFSAGFIAMMCTTIMKKNTFDEHGGFEMKVAPCPSFEGYEKSLPAGGTAMISFSTDEAKKAAAFEFMSYMVSQEGMETFTKTGYLCVTTDEVTVTEGQEAAYAQTVNARPWECWPGGTLGMELESMWLVTRNAIIMEGADVVESLTSLEAECNALLENG